MIKDNFTRNPWRVVGCVLMKVFLQTFWKMLLVTKKLTSPQYGRESNKKQNSKSTKILPVFHMHKYAPLPICLGFSLTLPVLRILSSKAQGREDVWKPFKPCHTCIYWKALTEYSQMSTNLSRFESFFSILHHFAMVKLATSSIRVKKGNDTSLWIITYVFGLWGNEWTGCSRSTFAGVLPGHSTGKVNNDNNYTRSQT